MYPCGGPNTDCGSQDATGLVVPGDAGVPAGLTQTYYKAFAPRIGIAWTPGASGKTSIRAGWGLFYNPVEQLVLEQFGAEPPFGGSTFVYETQFNQPFLGQDGATTYLNPFNGVLSPAREVSVDWATFEPILLFGDFQPHMRTQYSAQYNFTVERELARDMKLEVSYVGTQGHRLLATHDVNYSNPQTCLDINTLDGAGTCGPFWRGRSFHCNGPSRRLQLPYAQRRRSRRDRSDDEFCRPATVLVAAMQSSDEPRLPSQWGSGVQQHLRPRHHLELRIQLSAGFAR